VSKWQTYKVLKTLQVELSMKVQKKKFRRNEMLVATEFIPLQKINDTKQSSGGAKYKIGLKI